MIKEITIKINDVEYKVKKCVAALMHFEDATGINSFLMDGNFSNAVNMFYSMLIVNNKTFKYTIDEFKDILDKDDNLLTDYITYVLLLKSGEEKEDEKKN